MLYMPAKRCKFTLCARIGPFLFGFYPLDPWRVETSTHILGDHPSGEFRSSRTLWVGPFYMEYYSELKGATEDARS